MEPVLDIVAISGLWCTADYSPTWARLSEEFKLQFPSARFHIEQERDCQLWHIERLRAFARRIAKKYDRHGSRILLVGHSMGGVVADAVAGMCEECELCGLVTIFSPNGSLRRLYPRLLGATKKPPARVVSFKGRLDLFVQIGGKHPHAALHRDLFATHLGSLSGKRIPRTIVSTVKQELFH